jgi:dolichol-phosphate mannosyltransferase
MISLVIPTYNEAEVIQETLRRAAEVLRGAGEPFELIVVDDASPDGTAGLAEALSGELPVRVLRRVGERGLATAVVRGWGLARGDVLGVMDADLQHPPEVVCQLLTALRREDADVAVASRYRPGGGTVGWSWFRRLVSWAGMRVGAAVLPWTLGVVSDSGSGMFLVRAKALEGVELRPLGFKVLLEVLGRARYQKVVEVPYVFRSRARGQSKLGPRQYLEYVVSLWRIGRSSGELETWACYGLAGLGGAAVYVAILIGLADRTSWPLALTIPLSLQMGLVVNFLLDETVSFRRMGRASPDSSTAAKRAARYERQLLPGALINGLVTGWARYLGLELGSAALLGIAAGSAWNLVFAAPAIWRTWPTPPRRRINSASKA